MTVPVSIMWFRQDLRVKDNPALNAACDMGKIVPIYIYDDTTSNGREPGGASKWWLHHSLIALKQSLDNNLSLYRGDPKNILIKLTETYNVKEIFWNRCYEPWRIKRDKQIKSFFEEEKNKAYKPFGKGKSGTSKALTELGLNGKPSKKEIQDKFKELVKSLHPDINGKNQKNEEKLKVIINAYNQLKTSGLC